MQKFWLAFLLLLTAEAHGKPIIVWLQADLKPYFIQDGEHQGQGALQQAQQLLINKLPQFQHQISWSSLLRREQLLSSYEGAACSFGMLKTPERSALHYSIAITAASGYAVVMVSNGRLYQRWLSEQRPDVATWLPLQRDMTGLMEAGRAIPDFMRHINTSNIITFPLQTNPIALLAHGRADYLLEYPARANYLRQLYAEKSLSLQYVYLQQEANISYVACSPETPTQVIDDINAALTTLLPDKTYQSALLRWVDDSALANEQALYRDYILTPTDLSK